MAKYIQINTTSGNLEEVVGLSTSAGAGDGAKLIETDNTGRLDQSFMPVGVGPDTKTLIATETMASGDFVNIWDDAGTVKIRKADASTAGKESVGFVLDAITSGNSGLVYFEAINTSLTGLTLGVTYFLSTTPGTISVNAPTGAGNIVQKIGKAVSATEIAYEASQPIVLA